MLEGTNLINVCPVGSTIINPSAATWPLLFKSDIGAERDFQSTKNVAYVFNLDKTLLDVFIVYICMLPFFLRGCGIFHPQESRGTGVINIWAMEVGHFVARRLSLSD